MSNLSYRQPIIAVPPSRLLRLDFCGHETYVTSVSFYGEKRDRLITGSYDEMAKVQWRSSG